MLPHFQQSYLELQACLESGCPKSNEAAIVLLTLKRYFLDEEHEADILSNKLMRTYPYGPPLAQY